MSPLLTRAIVLAMGLASAILVSLFFQKMSISSVGPVALGTAVFVGALLPLRWFIVLMFCYLGTEGMLKIFSGYNPVIHVGIDILSAALVVKALALGLMKRKRVGRLPPFTLLFALHFIWFLIAFANPYQLSLFASAAGAKMYVTMVLLYFFGYYCTTSLKDVEFFMLPWLLICFVQSGFSIYQSSIGPQSVLRMHPGYYAPLEQLHGYAFRPFGLTAIPGGPAVFMFMSFPLILYFLLRWKSLIGRAAALVLVASCSVTLVLCQVRSAILKVVFGVSIFIFFDLFQKSRQIRGGLGKRTRPKKLIAALVIVYLALPTTLEMLISSNSDNLRAVERSSTAFNYESVSTARKEMLTRFVELVQTVPLGAGLSRTGAAAGKFAHTIAEHQFFSAGFFTDNFWLATMIDLGLPGMLILTSLVFLLLWRGFRTSSHFHFMEYRWAHIAITAALASCVLGFYGAESILYNPEACFFWFFAGVLMKLPVLDARHEEEERKEIAADLEAQPA